MFSEIATTSQIGEFKEFSKVPKTKGFWYLKHLYIQRSFSWLFIFYWF